jgi:hypothetical protein
MISTILGLYIVINEIEQFNGKNRSKWEEFLNRNFLFRSLQPTATFSKWFGKLVRKVGGNNSARDSWRKFDRIFINDGNIDIYWFNLIGNML